MDLVFIKTHIISANIILIYLYLNIILKKFNTASGNLCIREDLKKGVYVEGL